MDEGQQRQQGQKLPPARPVTLFWTREQYENGVCTASDSFTIDGAVWTVRNGTHYVTYEDGLSGEGKPEGGLSGNGGSAGNDKQADMSRQPDKGGRTPGVTIRTTLRISNHELTLIRHGAVRWNHTFRASQKASSTMYVGGLALSIETDTKSLAVHMSDCSGEVILIYDMDLSGMTQTVKLWIRFGEHDGESTKETAN
jgi:hypothetical protein